MGDLSLQDETKSSCPQYSAQSHGLNPNSHTQNWEPQILRFSTTRVVGLYKLRIGTMVQATCEKDWKQWTCGCRPSWHTAGCKVFHRQQDVWVGVQIVINGFKKKSLNFCIFSICAENGNENQTLISWHQKWSIHPSNFWGEAGSGITPADIFTEL